MSHLPGERLTTGKKPSIFAFRTSRPEQVDTTVGQVRERDAVQDVSLAGARGSRQACRAEATALHSPNKDPESLSSAICSRQSCSAEAPSSCISNKDPEALSDHHSKKPSGHAFPEASASLSCVAPAGIPECDCCDVVGEASPDVAASAPAEGVELQGQD